MEVSADRDRRILGLLGLAHRAGRVAVGYGAVAAMVSRGRRPVVLVGKDAGGDVRSKARRLDPVKRLVDDILECEDLARAMGRNRLSIVAVSAPDFVAGLLREIDVDEAPAESGREKGN